MRPEPVLERTRSGGPVALLVAAGGVAALEMLTSWAERWDHEPAYFALSFGLTLLLALPIGLVSALTRAPAGLALAAWIGLGLGVSWGWPDGLAATLVVWGASRIARGTSPSLLGAGAALGLVLACLKADSFAEHLGQADVRWVESLGAACLLAFGLGAVPWLVARFVPARFGPLRGALPLLLAGLPAFQPRLERGDGEHRLPPGDYATSAPRAESPGRPHVFLLVLDTVRADHLPFYGYGRVTMPALDRRVKAQPNAAVFPQAYANGTWTVPSHASLFTGELPNVHGAHFALDGSVRLGFGLAPALPTLAERMQASGYATLAAYGNHWLRSVEGMSRGFDRYLRAPDKDELPFVGEALRQRFLPGVLWEVTKGCARASAVNQTLLSLVEPWSRGPNPLFVFANYVDAHGPYAPPAPFRGAFAPARHDERSEHLALGKSRERIEQLRARYDEELLYLDHELEQLFATLERLELWSNAWVVLTADHGEAFGEHGVLEHGTTVHEEVTRVPLIVFPPEGVQLPVTNDPVSLVDVAATVAAIGGAELPGPGRDLRSLRDSAFHATVIEFYGDPVKASALGELARRPARSIVRGNYKLIAYADCMQLYDLERDPGEHVDLATALPHVVELLSRALPEFRDPTFRSDRDAPTPEALDSLRGLGYAGGFE